MTARFKPIVIAAALATALVVGLAIAADLPTARAYDLRLAPGLSFDDDSSANFPIEGANLSDGSISGGEATVIFFGTANCWNTAREAERLVKLYPQYKDKVHFVIVDLRNPSLSQRALIARYYHGYIPTIAVLGGRGELLYDRAGETAHDRGDVSGLQKIIDSAR